VARFCYCFVETDAATVIAGDFGLGKSAVTEMFCFGQHCNGIDKGSSLMPFNDGAAAVE
jgi:hypothetical protein